MCIFEVINHPKTKLMRKTLYIIGLSTFVFSCTSQQNVKKNTYKPKTPVTQAKPTVKPTPPVVQKPKVVSDHGVDFFTTNIADATKNDNTASYGSIVTAKPMGYKVVKTYFPAVAQNFRQRYLILHYTALPDDKSVTVLTQQAVSAHYLVNNTGDNEIYQLVDADQIVIVSVEIDGCAEDSSIYRFVHKFYTPDGMHCATAEATGVWIDMMLRKMTTPPDDVVEAMNKYKSPETVVLSREDFKKFPFHPHNIDPAEINI